MQLVLDWSKRSDFDGETFDQAQAGKRLARQLEAVRSLMSDGEWRTLAQIANACAIPEASASARLRDLRKLKFGALKVERRRANSNGLWIYRVSL